MAKLSTPKGKLVRKLGVNIFGNPKFDRLLSKKGYGPGQHGKSGKRFSTYSTSSFLPNNRLENLTELMTFSKGSSANS